jgi:uncharacterized protein (TIGR04255 family)
MQDIPNYKFPKDIELKQSPLSEAWLELLWELQPQKNFPQLFIDQSYPFSLGIFYNKVKDEFGFKEELDSSKAPEGILPNVVQYRFRKANNTWPLLQLGPGIAAVNFTTPYNWDLFKNKALYLQNNLIESYQDSKLIPKASILRYRNIFPFSFSSGNLYKFLIENLNTTIELPKTIPGSFGEKISPTAALINLAFDINKPKSKGSIRLGSGQEKTNVNNVETTKELLILEFEIASFGSESCDFTNVGIFENWLELSHSIIHEWFFSMINGKLFDKYK